MLFVSTVHRWLRIPNQTPKWKQCADCLVIKAAGKRATYWLDLDPDVTSYHPLVRGRCPRCEPEVIREKVEKLRGLIAISQARTPKRDLESELFYVDVDIDDPRALSLDGHGSPAAVKENAEKRTARDDVRLEQLRLQNSAAEKEREEQALRHWLKNCCLPPDQAEKFLKREHLVRHRR